MKKKLITDWERDQVQEAFTGQDIVDMFDIETDETGKKCLCPGHLRNLGRADSSPGAQIRDNGIYCWACHKLYRPIDITIDITGMDYNSAVRFLQQQAGITPLNTVDVPVFPYSQDELDLIGIRNHRPSVPVAWANEKYPHMQKSFEGEETIYVKFRKLPSFVKETYFSDRSFFHEIFMEKAVDAYEESIRSIDILFPKRYGKFTGILFYMEGKRKKAIEKLIKKEISLYARKKNSCVT